MASDPCPSLSIFHRGREGVPAVSFLVVEVKVPRSWMCRKVDRIRSKSTYCSTEVSNVRNFCACPMALTGRILGFACRWASAFDRKMTRTKAAFKLFVFKASPPLAAICVCATFLLLAGAGAQRDLSHNRCGK
jgi:hypothetical protein